MWKKISCSGIFILNLSLLFATCNLLWASKTYTVGELNQLVLSGNYPKQSKINSKSSAFSSSFIQCKGRINEIFSQVIDIYPTEIIATTSILHIEKIWTNDGTVTITCSNFDNKMIIVESKYE